MKFAYLIEPPFNYVDSAGHVTGCDVALARHVVTHLGLDPFEPVETTFAELLPGLSQGRWQMTTGLFATAERRALAGFSRPIWALADGLLVRQGNPLRLSGYTSLAQNGQARLGVIHNQVQHHTAATLGVPEERTMRFDTYTQAATALRRGQVDAYASVERAHRGFLDRHRDWPVESIPVPPAEKPPAVGCFAFAREDVALRRAVNAVLSSYLGSTAHRDMVTAFGMSQADVDLIAPRPAGTGG